MNRAEKRPIVEARALGRTYEMPGGQVTALRRVDLVVREGDYVSFMGPSGSGKTTLLNLIGCIDRPTEGDVLVEGRSAASMNDRDLDRLRLFKIGFIFQRVNLVPVLTALENVELPMELAGRPPRERRERAMELLDLVGLKRRADHRSSQLSAGEQQRVGVARALGNRPALILADEPTGNLDSKTGAEISGMLDRLNRENGQTIIVVTHCEELGARAKTRWLMRDGMLLERRG